MIQTSYRNIQIAARTTEELLHLRDSGWRLYQQPEPLSLGISGKTFLLRPGLTFTPFANAVRCNAHCAFCSEELRREELHDLTAHALIRNYATYFEGLHEALICLSGVPMGLSLSGLEATAEPVWMMMFLELLGKLKGRVTFDEKVLYSNGSGLVKYPNMPEDIREAGFDRIEWSRCHYDEEINQSIMRFNRNQPVWRKEVVESGMRKVNSRIRVKASCILTRSGVNSMAEVENYLGWIGRTGVQDVVFRELSRLDGTYLKNSYTTWIEKERVPVETMLSQLVSGQDEVREGWTYLYSTIGYYYYNEHYRYRNGMEVIFETSSYPALMSAHQSGVIHKLVYHSNGNLCGDWNPEACVIARFGDATA